MECEWDRERTVHMCVVCHHFNSLIWLFQKMNHHPNMETWRCAWAVFKLLTDIGPLLAYSWTETDVVVAAAAAVTAAVVIHLVNGCFSSLLNRILITDICRRRPFFFSFMRTHSTRKQNKMFCTIKAFVYAAISFWLFYWLRPKHWSRYSAASRLLWSIAPFKQ